MAFIFELFAIKDDLMFPLNASIMTTYLTFSDQFVIKGVL